MKISIFIAEISKSRSVLAAITLGTSLWFVACSDAESTADNYIKAEGATRYSAEPAASEATPATTPTPPASSGDPTKGATLLKDCAACHNPAGLAKAVTLNAAAIARLDTAYKTSQVALHSGFKATHFEGAGRLDVEAALKVITLK